MVRLGEDRCPHLQDQSQTGSPQWMEISLEPLAGVPGFRCPRCIVNDLGKQESRMGRSTGFDIGHIWTPTQLQLMWPWTGYLPSLSRDFPNDQTSILHPSLEGMLYVEHVAQRLARHEPPQMGTSLSQFVIGHVLSLLALRSHFSRITGPLLPSSSERPGLRQGLRAGADQAQSPRRSNFQPRTEAK